MTDQPDHPLRQLPAIDALLNESAIQAITRTHGVAAVKEALREMQAAWRRTRKVPAWSRDAAAYARAVDRSLRQQRYQTVFNLSGTMLHTNLGRAPLPADAFDAVRDLVTRPMNLEFDLRTGQRGEREGPVTAKLRRLTGAPAATIVNNCAAALMLALNTLALGRSVPVSRGELIEIGGSFRLPELMQRAGCHLSEVGTTNRTHLRDYAGAINTDTALLLRVHPSNYRIDGFTHAPTVRELADLAHAHDLPLCVDLGSGALLDFRRWGLPHEPTPREILDQGADLVLFSGDKLLGAVQAGILVGRADLIAACSSNPMKRALRADKVSLALLDELLARYEAPESLAASLPLLAWVGLPTAELERRGTAIADCLQHVLPRTFTVAIEPSTAEMGSGTLPEQTLPSRAVTIAHADDTVLRALHAGLRELDTPVISRIGRGRVWLDLRGADPLEELLHALRALAGMPGVDTA